MEINLNRGLFTSHSCNWSTPRSTFEPLNVEFHFTLDVCATRQNTKCLHYYPPEWDGLSRPWVGVCWCNPPYGRQIGSWIKKAWESSLQGATVVCLVPARTDSAWWHDYAMKAEVRFLR